MSDEFERSEDAEKNVPKGSESFSSNVDQPAEHEPSANGFTNIDSSEESAAEAESADAQASFSCEHEEKASAASEQTSSVEYGPSFSHAYKNADAYAQMKRKNRSTGRFVALFVALSVIAVAIAGLGGLLIGKSMQGTENGDTPNGSVMTPILGGTNEQYVIYRTDETAVPGDGSIASVAGRCVDSVVEIKTQTTTTRYPNKTVRGAGSGVIFAESAEGIYTYIITNNHVIEGVETIVVRTTNGTEYEASLVGTDWQCDIAVLRIEAKGLSKAQFANSDNLVLGQNVIAIGNPLGSLGGSVSDGIISGLSRTIAIEGVPMTLLQTNAAINPGNSGGGLFDMNGNLVGIVNAKSVGDDVDNIGFAIPANAAQAVAIELMEKGFVTGRTDLGFSFGSVTSAGLSIYSYAYNSEVSTAIESGYVLYSLIVDGSEIQMTSLDAYRGVLATLKVGDVIQARVLRPVSGTFFTQYQTFTVNLTVHERVN